MLAQVKPIEALEIDIAAEAFGVSPDTLRQRLDGGAMPEAIKHDGRWALPSDALATIANREGWSLDLTSRGPTLLPPIPAQVDRYINETMAAHAAVVLAKTQATAARAEAQALARQIRTLTDDLETERAESERATEALAASEKSLAIIERDKAVSEARAEEVRKQVEQERVERSLLSKRIGTLEADREEALASMGWWSRRRYERRRNSARAPMAIDNGQPTKSPPPVAITAPTQLRMSQK